MQIAPTPVHQGPINSPAAWMAGDFKGPQDWSYALTPAMLGDIRRTVERLRKDGKTINTISREDFDFPSFTADARKLRHQLEEGIGFVLISGFDIVNYSDDEATMVYWGIGAHLGTPLPQNVKGDRVYSVRNEGQSIEKDYGKVGTRFSKTNVGLGFHTDSAPVLMGNTPDLVCLLALQVAREGGDSAIVSMDTVHNIMLRERPDLLERLYQPYYVDRRMEQREGESPTLYAPIFTYERRLEARFFKFYIPKGYEVMGQQMSPLDVEAIEYMESVMNREGVAVYFSMKRGDMQFVNNRFILHSRTAFQDWPEPERRRHLIRLWLKFLGSSREN